MQCRAPWHCHLFYFKSIFFLLHILRARKPRCFWGGAFSDVLGWHKLYTSSSSCSSRHASTVCQKEFPPFCTSILRLIRSSQSLYFKLASFRARIFSNFTNSLIPQLSLSVQIVTDGAGNQDWSLESGAGGRLVTLTINKKDHKISDQSLNSLPLDPGY